jgi:hypothetical protein
MLRISPHIRILRAQRLHGEGKLLVHAGQHVDQGDIIAEEITGTDYLLLDISRGLGIPEGKISQYLHCQSGSIVENGDILAGPLGISRRVVRSPIDGQVALIHEGKVLLKTGNQYRSVHAVYPGKILNVIDQHGVVIESSGTLIEGEWGSGDTATGKFHLLEENSINHLDDIPQDQFLAGRIVCVVNRIDSRFIQKLYDHGISGLVLPGIDPALVAFVSSIEIPVLLLIGFGELNLNANLIDLLRDLDGKETIINPAEKRVPDGIRPELFFPRLDNGQSVETPDSIPLEEGCSVRVTNGAFFGSQGIILRLEGLNRLPNGIFVDTAEVLLESGRTRSIPVPNLIALSGKTLTGGG